MAEDAGTRWVQGEDVSPADLATVVNCLNRTCAVLGYTRLAKEALPTLAEYSIQHAGAEPVEDAAIITDADEADPDALAPEPVTASQAASMASDFAAYLRSKGDAT